MADTTRRIINLGERRLALKPIEVTSDDGDSFLIAARLPASALYDMMALLGAKEDPLAAREGLRQAFATVFGETDWRRAMDTFSQDEFMAIINEAYWVVPGEALASLTS